MSQKAPNAQTDIFSYAYAFTVLAGGLAGYAKAGSIPSLAAGVLFSSIAAFGAYQTSNNPASVHTGLLASGTLMTFMGYRFINSGKFMPAGLVAVLSAAQLIRLGVRLTK
jgi:uncharacterized membrane protein (UPF0136 family)